MLATEPSSIEGKAFVVNVKYVFHLRDEDARALQQDAQNWGNDGARRWDQARVDAMGMAAACEPACESMEAMELVERGPSAVDHVDLLCHEKLEDADATSGLMATWSDDAKMLTDDEIEAFLKDIYAECGDSREDDRAGRTRDGAADEVITVPETSEDSGPPELSGDASRAEYRATTDGEGGARARKRRRRE